jgi:hypothetical protein
MSSRAFVVGDRVRVVGNLFRSGPADSSGAIGIVRSVDKERRRTEPYYIYFVEFPGENKLTDFEYRELELVSSESD